jgi:aldehyde dehydrogenase (NAD+)
MAAQPPIYRNLIAGEWVDSASGGLFDDVNPAHIGQVVGKCARSTAQDVERAVDAAAQAFPKWSGQTGAARGEILYRAAEVILQRTEEIAHLFTREEGKPIRESRAEVVRAAQIFRYFAGEGHRLGGETLPSARKGVFLFTLRQPLGVAGIIAPWNFPIAIPAWKIAPALICGNAVVFKPASQAPLTGIQLAQALVDAGVPPGVLNVVTGPGQEVGAALLRNPQVGAISFTGSTEIGQEVYREASRRLIRVQCEMGGKNPLVILADADLDRAVNLTVEGAFSGTGQKCSATSRVIVERPVLEPFLARLVEATRALRVGDGLEEDTFVGPAVDERQMQVVLDYIAAGCEEGARLVCGGQRLTGPEYDDGYFIAPTIFADVHSRMRIAQEEIFGPVVGIIAVDDFEEALRAANDTRYGLMASICTRSLGKAHRFLREVRAGIVGVNVPTVGVELQAPFGGTKASGTAFKEQGKVAIEFYSELKTVALDAMD